MNFALKLKSLREEYELTQAQFANKLGVSAGCVGMWESTSQVPKSTMLIKIADFFGVTVDELLGREDFTPEERAAGASPTRTVKITPIEDDALYVVREIGKRFGEQAQRDYITVGENMLKLK